MPVIKKKTVIKKGSSFVYDPATFAKYKRPNFITVDSAEEMYKLFKDAKLLVMDTEDKPQTKWSDRDVPAGHIRRWIGTGKTASPVDTPFCISIGDGQTFATLYDDKEGCPEINKLKNILENPAIEKIFHNAKFDMHMLRNVGIQLKGKVHDTMLIAKLVNENRKSFTLMSLAEEYKGIVDFEYMVDLYKKTYKCVDYSKIPRELMTQYAK